MIRKGEGGGSSWRKDPGGEFRNGEGNVVEQESRRAEKKNRIKPNQQTESRSGEKGAH